MSQNVAFVFPGQGSQRAGMLQLLPDPQASSDLLHAAEDLSGLPLERIAAEGPDDALADTRVAQPLLYIADLSWAKALEERGVTPEAVAGHSLGEFAALAFAGVFDEYDGLALVCERGRLMAEAASGIPGAMAAVLGLDLETVSSVLDQLPDVWVANENAPGQTVISGTLDGIGAASDALLALGARRIVRLAVSGAFHCPLMASAAEAFSEMLGNVRFAPARMHISQNVASDLTRDPDVIRARLASQMTSPVRWTSTMEVFRREGIQTLVECGPGSVLAGLARRLDGVRGVSVEADGLDRIVEVVSA